MNNFVPKPITSSLEILAYSNQKKRSREQFRKKPNLTEIEKAEQLIKENASEKSTERIVKYEEYINVSKKEKKIVQEKPTKMRKLLKRPIYTSTLFLQRLFRLKKAKKSLVKSCMPSLEMIDRSPFITLKMYLKAIYTGWKTRKIIKSKHINNLKMQVDDIKSFYKDADRSNRHVVNAKTNYV
jgi:hypothetical protein